MEVYGGLSYDRKLFDPLVMELASVTHLIKKCQVNGISGPCNVISQYEREIKKARIHH